MQKPGSYAFVLLALAFLEGAAIMCLQLAAGSFLSPYFGSTLQTWAVLIGVVFAAFAAGYYRASRSLWPGTAYVLLSAGACLLANVCFSRYFTHLISLGPVAGMFSAAGILVFIPVALLSSIPVAVTAGLANTAKRNLKYAAGFSNGLAFFVSTLGGVLAAFLTGFWLIPAAGPVWVLMWLGIMLFAAGALAALRRASARGRIFMLMLAATVTLGLIWKPDWQPRLAGKKIIHLSHGMLGQIIVAEDTAGGKRIMYLNGSAQSHINLPDYTAAYGYVWDVVTKTDSIGAGNKVLILGMGGGYLASHFSEKGAEVDLVELDARIPQVAATYFSKSKLRAKVHVDDARHFINSAGNEKKYDLIVVDVYTGDNAPFHIITRESFAKMRQLLNEDGLLCVYFPYSLEAGMQAGYKLTRNTLAYTGFQVLESEAGSGRLLIYCRPSQQRVAMRDEEIFSDNNPRLELLLRHQQEVLNTLRKNLWQRE